ASPSRVYCSIRQGVTNGGLHDASSLWLSSRMTLSLSLTTVWRKKCKRGPKDPTCKRVERREDGEKVELSCRFKVLL
ncbi:unnamed protein product, partial [Musa acuminata var. zebrina]